MTIVLTERRRARRRPPTKRTHQSRKRSTRAVAERCRHQQQRAEGFAMLANIADDAFEKFYNGLVDRLPSILTALVVFVVFYIRLEDWCGRHSQGPRAASPPPPTWTSGLAPILLPDHRRRHHHRPGRARRQHGRPYRLAGPGLGGTGLRHEGYRQQLPGGLHPHTAETLPGGRLHRRGRRRGTVEDIRIRDTILKRPDGRLVFVPNNNIFTSAVTNNTAAGHRRNEITPARALPGGRGQGSRADRLYPWRALEGILPDPACKVGVEEVKEDLLQVKAVDRTEPDTDAFEVKNSAILAFTHRPGRRGSPPPVRFRQSPPTLRII